MYLTNHTTRGSRGIKPKSQLPKQRVYAHDMWMREDPDGFNKALAEHQAANPSVVLNVGTRRSLTIELFQKLPEAEQEKYKQMATNRLKMIRALTQLTG